MTGQQAEGYKIAAVESWIEANIEGLKPPFRWTRLEGGHSNLTYRLDDANGRQAVVRRPPQGELLPKAHDMSREWALLSALAPTPVPVPPALGFCKDPEVTGAAFYLMGLVDGQPLYTAEETAEWVPEDRRVILAHHFFDTLADLHELDPDVIGLGELARKENYLGRQLKTWYRSWTSSVEAARFDDLRVHRQQQYFLEHMPEQGMARVVHGDYGLHNCLIGAGSTISAVVDWEIATLGDPMADLAYALNQWPESAQDLLDKPDAATSVSGFPTRSELAGRYAERTGRSLDNLNYYMGFNYWRYACITHGVYARYREGKKSTVGVDLENIRWRIDYSLNAAQAAIQRTS